MRKLSLKQAFLVIIMRLTLELSALILDFSSCVFELNQKTSTQPFLESQWRADSLSAYLWKIEIAYIFVHDN